MLIWQIWWLKLDWVQYIITWNIVFVWIMAKIKCITGLHTHKQLHFVTYCKIIWHWLSSIKSTGNILKFPTKSSIYNVRTYFILLNMRIVHVLFIPNIKHLILNFMDENHWSHNTFGPELPFEPLRLPHHWKRKYATS